MTDRSYNRVFLVVMDSLGIGNAPDAKEYNDEGADTLGAIVNTVNGLHIPHLNRLGIGYLKDGPGLEKDPEHTAYYGKMNEQSKSKDTMTGHWELMGLYIDKPFKTFPNGFPKELIVELESMTGRKVIGNKVASGTEIIKELGAEHVDTGALIVYTSADSVLQIAAHEAVVPLEELYDICKKIRERTKDEPYMLGRIIARPFIGEKGSFERTSNRHDYALKPFGATVLNALDESGYTSQAIGKIDDIFDGEGINERLRTTSNMDGMDKLLQSVKQPFTGLSFLNLVDFDALFGHRRDPHGYGKAIEEFDARLPDLLDALEEDDLLILTADHGNDPTYRGTDHTREQVPLLLYSKSHTNAGDLGTKETFADVGATIADNFNVTLPKYGTSFLPQLKGEK